MDEGAAALLVDLANRQLLVNGLRKLANRSGFRPRQSGAPTSSSAATFGVIRFAKVRFGVTHMELLQLNSLKHLLLQNLEKYFN